MLDNVEQTNYNRHVESFYVGSKFVWRKLLLVGDVEVKVTRNGIWYLLYVIYLLQFQ